MSAEIKIFRCALCCGYYVAVEDESGYHHKNQCCPHAASRRGALKREIESVEMRVIDDDDDDEWMRERKILPARS